MGSDTFANVTEQHTADAASTASRAAPGGRGGRLGARVLAVAGACVLSMACAQPAAAPNTPDTASSPAPRSAGEALARYQTYEVGWLTATGEVAYSKVTSVAMEPDGNARIELAEPSLLWGSVSLRAFSGHWKDAGGEGEIWFEYVPDYSSAAGWWTDTGSSEKRDIWLRSIQ